MPERRIVRTIWSVDRKHRLDIYQRSDGHFGYAGVSLVTEDGETYWAPSDLSGIHETAEGAERDAMAEVPWMKERGQN
jgi:hypothetical protein